MKIEWKTQEQSKDWGSEADSEFTRGSYSARKKNQQKWKIINKNGKIIDKHYFCDNMRIKLDKILNPPF